MPYNSSDLYEAERISEIQRVSKNLFKKRVASGFYRDVELPEPFFKEGQATKKYQELEGVTPQKYQDLYNFVEMHVDLDLPGYETEVKVPYIVTLDEDSMTILSIYSRSSADILPEPLQPGEFRDVDAPGGNIRDQFQLLPFKEPSGTLFNLLGFCVDAGRRFAAIADLQVGDGNQAAAVGTTVALLERGSRVMSAIHKRAYYSMKEEFKIMARIIGEYLPPEYPYNVVGGNRIIKLSDFDDRIDIIPVADPNIFSMSQRVTLAQTELQLAQANPQIHNMYEAYRRMYEALGVRNIDTLLQSEPEPPQPIDPALENTAALQMQLPKAFPEQNHDAHIAAHMSFIRTRMVQSNPSVYALLQGHISEHVSLKAKQEVLRTFMQQPNLVQLQQTNPEEFVRQFNSAVAEQVVALTNELVNQEMAFLSQTNQDPLVALKQRELDLKAQDIARKAQETAARLDVETNKFEAQQNIAEDKLNLQEEVQRGRLKIQQEKAREEKS